VNAAAIVGGLHDDGDSKHHLPDEVMTSINRYTPQIPTQYWAYLGDFVRAEVAAASPDTVWRAKRLMMLTTQLSLWVWQTSGNDLTRENVFDPHTIDRYFHQSAYSPAFRARGAAILLAMTQQLNGGPRQKTKLIWRKIETQCYEPTDFGWMRSWAARQAKPEWRKAAHAMLGYCLGAGLSVNELVNLRACDVEIDGDYLLVHIRGPRPRTIPVDEAWTSAARSGLGDTPENELILMPKWKKSRRDVLVKLVQSSSGESPTAQRCRSTYIADKLLRGTPASALQAAGVTNFASLDTYRRFLQPVSLDDLKALSRGAAA
jgi:integrase